MADVNFFATRDQYLFICYNDIIKFTYPVMLHELIHDYYDELNLYLRLDEIKDYDIYNLERLCVERMDKNPLKYIKREDCPDEICDVLLEAFEDELVEMYTQSKLTVFGANLYILLNQPFIKEVYIYSERPREQIPYDFKVYFGEYLSKIKFVGGDFIEMVKSLPHRPTSYFINDTDYIQKLIDNDLISYTEILVAEIGYNFEVTKEGELQIRGGYEYLMEKEIFKLCLIPIINLEQKHFTQLKSKEDL